MGISEQEEIEVVEKMNMWKWEVGLLIAPSLTHKLTTTSSDKKIHWALPLAFALYLATLYKEKNKLVCRSSVGAWLQDILVMLSSSMLHSTQHTQHSSGRLNVTVF